MAGPESAISIADLRWQNRVLITRVNSKSTKELLDLWQSEYHLELQDRRLRVFSYEQLKNPKKYQLKCSNCMLLVGLDGGIKSRNSISPDNLDAIFSIIDAMPMRRAELRN